MHCIIYRYYDQQYYMYKDGKISKFRKIFKKHEDFTAFSELIAASN